MNAEETADCLNHHLKIAGGADTLFSSDAVIVILNAVCVGGRSMSPGSGVGKAPTAGQVSCAVGSVVSVNSFRIAFDSGRFVHARLQIDCSAAHLLVLQGWAGKQGFVCSTRS